LSAIAGILPLDGSPPDPELLARMREALTRVAPHGDGVHVDAHVGLAHALLRTGAPGESTGGPITLDGRRWLVADARIDDRARLARDLSAAGIGASAGAPAGELILHALAAWGDAAPERLRGDFAFAAWDAERRRLLLARDHFGIKPLYLAHLPGALVFSSSLDCVRLHPAVSGRLDDAWLADFLVQGMALSADYTVYQDIRVVGPGQVLTVEDGRIATRRYWTLPTGVEPLRLRGPADYAERFREVLCEAVRDRLPPDGVGILLSGGRDSTALAGCWRELVDRGEATAQLRAYTNHHARLMADEEGRLAALVARTLGIPHHLQAVDDVAPFARWEAAELARPEPMDAPLLAIEAELHGRAAAHGSVLLTGQGADALLRESRSRLMGLLAGGHPLRAAREAAEYLRWHGRVPRPGVRTWLRREAPVPRPLVPGWLDPDFAARVGLGERLDAWTRWRQTRSTHPLHPEAHGALTSPFWPVLASMWAPATTGLPLEVRHPYLDLRLVELVLSIPPAQWYNDKGLLHIAMQGRLPREVLRRRKTPVSGDPIAVRRRALGEDWLGGRRVGPEVAPWVDLERLPRETGGRGATPSDRLFADLRPMALSLWLSRASRSRPFR
jgi:asparagine synthase (glutamine-hydrolysing)